MANVEATEQSISIVLFLLLVLTNVGESLCSVFLPLGMLMKSVADFLLALFNCGEPGVDTSEVHRLLMVHGRWLMMTHEWTMKARRMVMETPCRKTHASPRMSLEISSYSCYW
jgi:hypothetical protein